MDAFEQVLGRELQNSSRIQASTRISQVEETE
jgi:hypothetical protein